MKTPLFDRHVALGAKMGDFCGWEMPLHYPKGTIFEHLAVRKGIGLFDISHMGRISVFGNDAENLLDYLATNQIEGRENHSVSYSVLCSTTGGSVDDVLIFKEDALHFSVIVNSFNRQKVLDHLLDYGANMDVLIKPHFQEGMLAIQGPRSPLLMGQFFLDAIQLKYMHFFKVSYRGSDFFLSRTGYTGSIGFEIAGSASGITALWDEFLESGKVYGIEPVGRGARETLRLEMGYALYGHELSETIAPSESVSSWTVKWGKPDFLGKEALDLLEVHPSRRYQHGVIVKDRQIARAGTPVLLGDDVIGTVVSGNYSPILNEPIGIIMVDRPLYKGSEVTLEVRHTAIRAEIVDLPFVPIDCKQIEKMVKDRQLWFRGAKSVYLGCGLEEIVDYINARGYHIVNKTALNGDCTLNSCEREKREMAKLDQAAMVIVDCSLPDSGSGRIIEYARTKGLLGKVPAKVLCLYNSGVKTPLSYLIEGMTEDNYPHVLVRPYTDVENIKEIVSQYIEAFHEVHRIA